MLKLSTPKTDDYWLDLSRVAPGLRLKVKPISVAMMAVARQKAGKVFDGRADDESVDPETSARYRIALVRELAHAGIEAWEGIVDDDEQPAPVTAGNVDKLLDLLPIYDRLDRDYAQKAFDLDAEKNGSSNGQDGSSKGAANTAGPAL